MSRTKAFNNTKNNIYKLKLNSKLNPYYSDLLLSARNGSGLIHFAEGNFTRFGKQEIEKQKLRSETGQSRFRCPVNSSLTFYGVILLSCLDAEEKKECPQLSLKVFSVAFFVKLMRMTHIQAEIFRCCVIFNLLLV